jgi:hypothetical protein
LHFKDKEVIYNQEHPEEIGLFYAAEADKKLSQKSDRF